LPKEISGQNFGFLRQKVAQIYLSEFWGFFKLRPNHFGDILQKKMHPMPKNFAKMVKFRPMWSH
jgi:hypothetical protein